MKFRDILLETNKANSIQFDALDTNTYSIIGKNAKRAGDLLDKLMTKEIEDEGLEVGDDEALDILDNEDVINSIIKNIEKKFKVTIAKE